MCVFSGALVVTHIMYGSNHHIPNSSLVHITSTKVMHKERAEKQKGLFAPSRKEGSERSIDSHSHSLASRSPPASPVRVGGTSLAAAAAGGGLSSLSVRLDSPSGGRPRLQLAPRTKPLPKLEIKKVPPNDDDDDDDAVADQNTANQGRQDDVSDDGKQGGSDMGNASTPSKPGEMKILARPKDQKKEDDKTGKDKDGKGKVIDVAASKRLISGALGGLGGKSGKGGAKSTGGARVVGETEVVSAPDGTVSYRITIGGDDDDDHDHDHDDESASASSSTGPSRNRGNRRGRGRGGGGRGGRGGRTHGGRGRGRTRGGVGGRGRGGDGDGEEKSKASKSEKKQQQQHRAPSRFEKQSNGSVKLYKGKSSKGAGKGGASGNTKQTGSKQSSLSAAASKGGKK